jgi:hypothetical protein
MIDQLTIQYYNALVDALQLNPEYFQLYQGTGALGNTNAAIWNIYNAIPPDTINHLYNPGQFNNFSQNYGAVLNALVTNNSDVNDPVTQALLTYTSAAGVYGYTVDLSDVLNLLKIEGKKGDVSLIYTAGKKTSTRSWSGNNVNTQNNFFSIEGDNVELSNKIVAQQITILGEVHRFVVVPGLPLDVQNSGGSSTKPWYNLDAMKRSYLYHNDTVWRSGAFPTWNSSYGSSGNLQRFCAALVVGDGIRFQTTSLTRFSNAEQSQLSDAIAENGVFPFYMPQYTTSVKHGLSFKPKGELIFQMEIQPGSPCILGVLVYPTLKYLSEQSS